MTKQRIGIYPGTFDPVTNGHMDIIQRATHLVDHLVIAVARNAGKGPLFSADDRVEMVRQEGRDPAGEQQPISRSRPSTGC